MIHSIFILNGTGEVIIEKHYRGNSTRTEPTPFWTQTAKSTRGTPVDIPPFIPTANGTLIHLQRDNLFFLASLLSDTPPHFVTHFLATLADIFVDYFGELNEHAIKDNFITVYELLDQILDSGFPLTAEPNTLKELIVPPSMINRVLDSLAPDTIKMSTAVTPTLAPSHVPWRRSGVKYAHNEIFIDVVETLYATFSAARNHLSHLLVSGAVKVNCKLSGTPDVSMHLRSNAPFDDVAFHHCARYGSFRDTNTISYIPPDGPFTLLEYKIRETNGVSLPVEVQARVNFDLENSSGSVSITLVPRFHPQAPTQTAPTTAAQAGSLMLAHVMSAAGGKTMGLGAEPEHIMDNVVVRIPFGVGVDGSSLSANYGTVQFESATGMCTWNVGAVPKGKTPSLMGQISLVKDARVPNPQILVAFRIPSYAASGTSVDSLELMPGERYQYYKGLRCITKAGIYEVRT